MAATTNPLPSWNDGATRSAIVDFVVRVTRAGSPEYVAPEARVAVFDNDGTLWCEKPMPIELGFILERLAAMAEHDQALPKQQPWRAAYDKDYAWLSGVITKHYHGDDSDVKVLIGGILKAFEGMKVEDYQASAETFLRNAQNPQLKRPYLTTAYAPMVEYQARPDVFDDGPIKPVRIWSRIGRRPIVAVGNSNGDIPMLEYVAHAARPSLSVLVNHDDNQREIAYTAGAEKALERAKERGWAVASVKNDWNIVF
jgi:hypothetical protein